MMGNWVWLALLLCPLIMIPMMYFMMKDNYSGQSKGNHPEHLTEELEQLRIQNEKMIKEIDSIKNNAYARNQGGVKHELL